MARKMSLKEEDAETDNRPDLSLIGQMVGMKKGLAVMVEKGVLPTREMVLALMVTEKAVYASDGGFRNKDQVLGKIIVGFEQGAVSVEDILRATGIDPKTIRVSEGGFSLKALWDRIRPR